MTSTISLNGNGPLRAAHLIGVCGSGMLPIAKALVHLGVHVSGSDPNEDKGRALTEIGVNWSPEHRAENINGAQAVVFSTAIAESNPELVRAREMGLPLLHRSDMLAHLLNLRESVLIAGTHGKTTTTAMMALMLEAGGMDPWAFVGGAVSEFGGNLRIGGTRWAVTEADESDGSFLKLPANHAIITNLEPEHMNYWKTRERLIDGFRDFIARVPEDGHIACCVDDEELRALVQETSRPVVTWSIEGRAAHYEAREIRLGGEGSSFEIWRGSEQLATLELGVPGRQNVSNALGAFALSVELGAEPDAIAGALKDFHGVGRRFTRRAGLNGSLVVDDYAHHPTEIRATMQAALTLRTERRGRLVCVLQPHRYTRTRDFFDRFGPALDGADQVIVTDIYAAGETPEDGISGGTLAELMRQQIASTIDFIPSFDEIKKVLGETLKVGDIVLLLGAGNVTNLSHQLSAPVAEHC